MAICNHPVVRPFYLWLDVCSADLQAKDRVWLRMTLNVLTKTSVVKQHKTEIHYCPMCLALYLNGMIYVAGEDQPCGEL